MPGLFVWMLAVALATPPYAQPAPTVVVGEPDPFAWHTAPLITAPGADTRLELRLEVPANHVVYRDQLEVEVLEAGPLSVGDVDLPPASLAPDPMDGADLRPQYPTDVVVYVPISVPDTAEGGVPVKVRTRHQGCRPGLCFPPLEQTHDVIVAVRPE